MRFQVFENGKTVEKLDLSGAYLFGSDGIAIRGAEVRFNKGFVECGKNNLQTAALVLPWQVEGLGKTLMATTCLPERERPYNLNVEMARGKLMQIINKREDWSLFNAGIDKKSRNAQKLFIEAVQSISDMPRSSKLADDALKEAVAYSEELAVKQAEALFANRTVSRGFGKGCLGCRIDPGLIDRPRYLEKLLALFNSVVIPVSWGGIEKEKGQYDFSEIDVCVNALSKKRLATAAGPILCFSEEHLPKWLTSQRTSFERVRESSYRFVAEIVKRYSERIRSWVVVSGMNCCNYFGFSFEQILELTRAACMAAKASNEKVRKIIEIQKPWGEYYASAAGTIPPLVYVDMVVQSGINFEGFGLEMSFGVDSRSAYKRDMLQISALLDYLAPVAKPFWITNAALSSRNSAGDEQQQKRWLERFYKIALSKPFVDAVIYRDLADSNSGVTGHGGLLTEQLEPKETFNGLRKIKKTIFDK